MMIDGELVDKGLRVLKDKMAKTLEAKGRKPFIGKLEFLGAAEEEFLELTQAVGDNDHDEVLEELLDLAILAVFEAACVQSFIDRASGTVYDTELDAIYSNLAYGLKAQPRAIFHSIHHILGDVSTEMTRYRLGLAEQRSNALSLEASVGVNDPFDLAESCFHGIISVVSGGLEW